jgi:ABC-type histidine transport system ATPase subunit
MRVKEDRDVLKPNHQLLERVGIPEKAGSYPRASGGNSSVAIAGRGREASCLRRADVGVGPGDDHSVGVMRDLAQEGMTMLVVSHEMGFAREAADRVMFMNEGRIEEEGPPQELFENPKSERTRRFLSRIISH